MQVKIIRLIDHFSALSEAQAARLLSGSRLKHYNAGARILDPRKSQAVYSLLISGKWRMVSRVISVAEPREWIDDRPGNWHGGIALIDKVAPPRGHSETDCIVLHAPRDLLDNLAADNAHLALTMLRGVSGGATKLFEHAMGTEK